MLPSPSCISSARRSSRISSSLTPAATSSRTAWPRCRAWSRSSISRSMSSDSCSSNSMSLSRVMRNVVLDSTSKPPNNSGSRAADGVFQQI